MAKPYMPLSFVGISRGLLMVTIVISSFADARILLLPSDWSNPPTEELFQSDAVVINFQPLIGILSQPGDGDGGETINGTHVILNRARNDVKNYSYIAASYVKWVEMGGARAVPILYNEPEEVILRKFKAVNGLLLPGGGTKLEDGPFYRTAAKLWKLAIEANDAGDYFPIQGTCMGMELLSILASQDMNILELESFDAQNFPSVLNFVGEWAKERSLFGWMKKEVRDKVETEGLTIENHEDGTSLERFLSSERLRGFFNILTTTPDKQGKVYVSTIEAKRYPVYATQWHPEKNAFEWGLSGIPHGADAIAVTQASADFFVNEARKSGHTPASEEERDEMLIYNYYPIYSGKDGKGFFDQSYVFNLS